MVRVSFCDTWMSIVGRAFAIMCCQPFYCYQPTGKKFHPIFIQLAQNVYLDEWMNPIENGYVRVKKVGHSVKS